MVPATDTHQKGESIMATQDLILAFLVGLLAGMLLAQALARKG